MNLYDGRWNKSYYCLLQSVLLILWICIGTKLDHTIDAQQAPRLTNYDWAKIPKDNFRQLTRNKVTASPCKLDRFHSNQRITHITADETNHSQVLKCNKGEVVTVVSLSDTVAIGADHSSNNQSDLITALCKSRIQVIKKRAEIVTSVAPQVIAGDNAIEANGFWQPDATTDEHQFENACNYLVRMELEILNSTNKLCSGKQTCNISYPTNVDSFKDCIQISNYDFVPTFQLNFVCLPEESVFYLTRVVKFADVDNTISCSNGRLLYIRRTNYSLNAINKWQNLPQPANYLEDEETKGSPSSTSDYKTPNSFGSERLCEFMKMIPRLIIAKCHSTQECSLNFGRIVNELIDMFPCEVNTDRLKGSYATISYFCMSQARFRDSDYARIPETDKIMSDVGDNSTTARNNIDFEVEPEFQTELGRRTLSQMAMQMSSSASGIHESGCFWTKLFISFKLVMVGFKFSQRMLN